MKLFELIGVKKFHNLSIDELIELYANKNLKLGKGSEAAAYVFEYSPMEVIKFWFYDPAYEKFLDYVNQNKQDKHLPVLKSKLKNITTFHNRPLETPNKIKYIKLEKLIPVKKYKIQGLLEQIEKIIDRNLELKDFKGTKDELSFAVTCIKVYKNLLGNGIDLDLHDENVMQRADGTLVLTDPVSGFEIISFNDLLRSKNDELATYPDKNKSIKGPSFNNMKDKL